MKNGRQGPFGTYLYYDKPELFAVLTCHNCGEKRQMKAMHSSEGQRGFECPHCYQWTRKDQAKDFSLCQN
jgi:hypothetical protein